jgi:hypothetical protein
MSVILSAQPLNNFNATVNVTCSVDFGGSCTGGSFTIGGTAANPIDVAITVPSGAPLGVHTLTVTATDGALTHSGAYPFYIADYSGSLSNSALTMGQGDSGSLTATATATAGFAGTLSFACTGATQVTCSFSPSNLQPTVNNPQTTNITVTAGYSASALPLKDRTRTELCC